MPKEEKTTDAMLWQIIKKHCNQSNVAEIKDPATQLAEIDRRLSALTDDLAMIGAAITPTAAAAALGINKDTFNRYVQALAAERDEKGNVVNVSLDKSGKGEAEKRYILDRCEIIKKYLQQGEMLASTAAQTRDNRENGGALFILQNVYGYGQQQGKDQVTFSLEDLLQAAQAVKDRQARTDKT